MKKLISALLCLQFVLLTAGCCPCCKECNKKSQGEQADKQQEQTENPPTEEKKAAPEEGMTEQ